MKREDVFERLEPPPGGLAGLRARITPPRGTRRFVPLAGAFAIAAALLLFVATAVPLLRGRSHDISLALLAAYFHGYEMSWQGALIGAAWAGFTGFVIGWFLAFSSNFVLAIRLVTLRARAEYAQTRDFMDHI